ncbi:YchJ family protein [Gryllotalpicola ginsengisoli]|uniref:YchJ family protein n=1 Tax=Gryllotalpicola ginsengisoli TaxID=444608 RepID=UPI0024800754|nr:YchJ family metal-binding protein [Gryllotalpicola ginsengisoli]
MSYGECCAPLLRGDVRAATAEQLMRSRYCAFALGDVDYVLRTWHPSTRPAPPLGLDDGTVWRRLDVLGSRGGGPFDRTCDVEFRAVWRRGSERGVLHETSRFVREEGSWLYVDGDAWAE